jgi:fumarate reductase subunit D
MKKYVCFSEALILGVYIVHLNYILPYIILDVDILSVYILFSTKSSIKNLMTLTLIYMPRKEIITD